MIRIAYLSIAAALSAAAPAQAVTNDSGQILITQAAVNAGGITPGDTPGFPVTISVAGSYRVASNLTVTTAVNGIEVRANEVKINLGGFTLAGSGVGRNGISSFNRTMRVEDGVVRGFSLDGIRSIAPFLAASDMVITKNGRFGFYADHGPDISDVSFARIVDSTVTDNGADGIRCSKTCRVENSTVSGNGMNGITFGDNGGMALGNLISYNTTSGIMFVSEGGAGNNTIVFNRSKPIDGFYIPMQPNACRPACTSP